MVYDQKIITYKGQVVFEKLSVPVYKRIPKSYQSNEACFMFVGKGEFSIRTPSDSFPLNPQKALLAKCFDYFFETNARQRAENEFFQAIGVLLYPAIVEELFQFDISKSTYRVDFNAKQVQVDGLLAAFRDSLDILLEHPELADEEMVKTKLREFILLISKTQNAPSHLDFLSAMFRPKANSFRATVRQNLYANLSLEELAHLCGMSLSSFKRKFAEEYGESPKKYIAKQKMEKAAQLLRQEEYRISEIAYECGFESIATFNRNFKSHFSMSPSAFRLNQNE